MANGRLAALVAVVVAVAAMRLVPHPPNVTPVTALALFGGAWFANRWLAALVPLAAMALSDLALGVHGTLPFVYGAFLMTVALGWWTLRERRSAARLAVVTVAASLLFYVVTNLGTWLVQDLYPKDLPGLVACYVAALPFLRNAILGDLLYTGLAFAAMTLVAQRLRTLPPVSGAA